MTPSATYRVQLHAGCGPISVVANLGDRPAAADVEGTVRLAWPPESTLDGRLVLPPDGVAVLERR